MDYSFIIVIIIIFLDLIAMFNAKIPLLNMFLGLFTIVFSFATYNSVDYQPWICLLLLLLASIVMMEGIKEIMK